MYLSKRFSHKTSPPNQTLIIPQEAGLAVLKGAVLFGFEPRIISTRICKATYGVKTNSAFKEGTDPEEKKTIIEGDDENRSRAESGSMRSLSPTHVTRLDERDKDSRRSRPSFSCS
jgi:hypothetical protein